VEKGSPFPSRFAVRVLLSEEEFALPAPPRRGPFSEILGRADRAVAPLPLQLVSAVSARMPVPLFCPALEAVAVYAQPLVFLEDLWFFRGLDVRFLRPARSRSLW